MSDYDIHIDCPHCGKESPGQAIDNCFGSHKYGYRCVTCARIWIGDDILFCLPHVIVKDGAKAWVQESTEREQLEDSDE